MQTWLISLRHQNSHDKNSLTKPKYSWLELRPYLRFKDKRHLETPLSRVQNSVAFFFARQQESNITRIIIRTHNNEKTQFENIDDVETIQDKSIQNLLKPFPFVKRMCLKRHYVLPIVPPTQTKERNPNPIFKTLEKIRKESCVIACYAKRYHAGASDVWSWITSKEAKTAYSKGTKTTPRMQNLLEIAKQKAREDIFFQCEVIIGAKQKATLDALVTFLPDGISQKKTIKQKTFSPSKFRRVKREFPFGSFEPKKPMIFSSKFPVLCLSELLQLVSLPEDVSRLRLNFGSVETYSQGPQFRIEDTPLAGLFDSQDSQSKMS